MHFLDQIWSWIEDYWLVILSIAIMLFVVLFLTPPIERYPDGTPKGGISRTAPIIFALWVIVFQCYFY
jgi:hypothetical protein